MMLYYIKKRYNNRGKWEFAYNKEFTCLQRFKDKKKADARAMELQAKERAEDESSTVEYKALKSEPPRNLTHKHKMYIPQYMNEFDEWQDMELDGDGVIFFDFEKAKNWVHEANDWEEYEKTRVLSFPLGKPTISYQKSFPSQPVF